MQISEETVEAMANRYESALARGDSSIQAMRSAIAASGLVEALRPFASAAEGIGPYEDQLMLTSTDTAGKIYGIATLTASEFKVVRALISPPTKEGERP